MRGVPNTFFKTTRLVIFNLDTNEFRRRELYQCFEQQRLYMFKLSSKGHDLGYSSEIEAVLKLGKLKASDIPSKSTVNDWNIMSLVMAQNQLREELPSQCNLGLLSDETSKSGSK